VPTAAGGSAMTPKTVFALITVKKIRTWDFIRQLIYDQPEQWRIIVTANSYR
jgi:hypothetical protein